MKSKLLSGLGYYRLSKQRRKLLTVILFGSLIAHLTALLILGSWVVIKSMRDEETVFVAPPPMKTYEPRKLEHRVKVQKRQRSSSRPAMTPRMVAMRPTDFSLPEIIADPKVVKTTFQPKFRAVQGKGMGMGLGTGYGLGGFGLGVSQFDFFGIRGRGDKIAILVDISTSMVAPKRGGEKGYRSVRRRVEKVIDALSEQALFNLIVYADASSAYDKGKMVIASDANKKKAKSFLRGFNTNGDYGLATGNLSPSDIGIRALGGETRLDLALTAAFEQNADTILVISDGLPRVRRPVVVTEQQYAAHAQRVAEWNKKNGAALREFDKNRPPPVYATKKVWVQKKKDGVAIGKGHWETRRVQTNRRSRPHPPGGPSTVAFWTLGDFKRHFGLLYDELYKKRGKKQPVLHCIGYKIDDSGSVFLKGLAKTFKGQYRRVGSLD